MVRSSRRSGTRQAACGLKASAMASISSVVAISRLIGRFTAPAHGFEIGVADVAAVFAQVDGDAVGAGGLCDRGGLGGIGMHAAARVADGGDVIDVHPEAARSSFI